MEKSGVDITFNFLSNKDEEELSLIERNWNGLGNPPIITKRLEKLIKSVAGNPDPMNIRNFIETLPILDSQKFRKYVADNKPGVDLTQQVIAPSGEQVTLESTLGLTFFALSTDYKSAQYTEIIFLVKKGFTHRDVLEMPTYLRRYYVERIIELEKPSD